MINFIQNTSDSSAVFKDQAYLQTGVSFAPKLVHTGSFTIESYLEFGKVDFDFEPLENLYEQFNLPKKTTRLFNLDAESLLIVHYWSHLLVDSKHTILELPEVDFSEQFIQALMLLISYYNQREITIITNNNRVIEVLKQLDQRPKKLLPIYKFKMNKLEIANMFIGEKILVLATLIIALIIIFFSIAVDSHLTGDYANYLQLPNNAIFIDNSATDCSYNKASYSLENEDCLYSDPISYAALSDLLTTSSDIDSIIFDDQSIRSQFEQTLKENGTAQASVPDLGFKSLTKNSVIPCLNPGLTPGNVTCTSYDPTNSLISIATINDSTSLERNINANQTSQPDFIIIESTDVDAVSNALATTYPSINIYTNHATENYLLASNSKLIISSFLSGTLVSMIAVLILNLLISQMKLYMRGHKYLLSYLTKNPIKVRRIFYASQIIYFAVLFIIGSVIAANLIHSVTIFLLSSYLGILNITLWILFSDINGANFKQENIKLYNRLKTKD